MKISIKNFRNIIDEVSLEIEKNKITTLIGDNGVGKTNILEAINFFTNNYENVDVQVTSNFSKYNGFSEEDLNTLREINFSFTISDKDVFIIEKKLKSISVKIENLNLSSLVNSRSKKATGLSFKENCSIIQIFNEIISQKKDIILKKYYAQDESGDYWPIFNEIDVARNNKSLSNKDVLLPIFDCIISLKEIFYKKPLIKFINNANSEFKLEHKTDILNLDDEELKKEVEVNI